MEFGDREHLAWLGRYMQTKTSTEKTRKGRWSSKKCPRCGCCLLENDHGQEWCSYVGHSRMGYSGCHFGMDNEPDSIEARRDKN